MAKVTSNQCLDKYIMKITHHTLHVATITIHNYDLNNVQVVFYHDSKAWQMLINHTIELNKIANGNTYTLSAMFSLLCNNITIMEDDENAYD